MSGTFDRIALWLADNLHLSTMLLAGALVLMRLLRQPVRRLVVAKATIMAMFLLTILVALPGWSIIHLCIFEDHAPPPAAAAPSSSSSLAATPPPITPQLAAPENLASPTEIHRSPINLPAFTWPQIIVGIYAVGAATVFAWLALGMFAATRLICTSQPAPESLHHLAAAGTVAQRTSVSHDLPVLRVSGHIQVPVALGLTRPTIILPSSWLTNRTPAELRVILAHEHAHIQNGDLCWLAISRALLILLWPQPLYWLLRRQMRLDQESLADAAAADLTDRHEYAEHLVAWARALPRDMRPALTAAVGLWESPSQLRRRVALLLSDHLTILRQCPRPWRLATTAIALIAAAALSPITLQTATQAETQPAASTKAENPNSSEQPSAARPLAEVDRPTSNVLSGRITDENGQPLTGIQVKLYRFNLIDRDPHEIETRQTDQDGRYQFDLADRIKELFPDGKLPELGEMSSYQPFVRIVAHAPGRVTAQEPEFAARVARIGAHFEHQMPPASALHGRVTDPDGKPVAGALVSAGGELGRSLDVYSAHTDADGHYVIDDIAPFNAEKYAEVQKAQAAYALKVAKDTPGVTGTFSASPPMLQVTHPDFATKSVRYGRIPGTRDVQLAPAAAITGRVIYRDTKQPAAGVLVRLMNSILAQQENAADQAYWFNEAGDARNYWTQTKTDADGRYQFTNLPIKEYDFWAETDGWLNRGVGKLATAAGQTTTAPDLVFEPGQFVHIRLVDIASPTPNASIVKTTGKVFFGVQPEQHLSRRPAYQLQATGETDHDERLTVRALPGKAKLYCTPIWDGQLPKWSQKLDANGDGIAVHIRADRDIDVEIPMEKIPARPSTQPSSSEKTDQPAKPSSDKPAAPSDPTNKNRSAKQTGDVVPATDNLPAGQSPASGPDHSEPKATGFYVPYSASVVAMNSDGNSDRQANAISLHCVDENGAVVAGVEATLFRVAEKDGSLQRVAAQSSDNEGLIRFSNVVDIEHEFPDGRVPNVPDGKNTFWQIVARLPGRASFVWAFATLEIARYGEHRRVKMPAAVALRRRITGPDGKPVAGAQVVGAASYVGQSRDGARTARTDADGRYEITDLPPSSLAEYQKQQADIAQLAQQGKLAEDTVFPVAPILTVEHPNFAKLSTWYDAAPGVKDVQLQSPAITVGRVIYGESGKPASSVVVEANCFDAIPSHVKSTTDETGQFRFSNLPAGSYSVWADAEGWLNHGGARVRDEVR